MSLSSATLSFIIIVTLNLTKTFFLSLVSSSFFGEFLLNFLPHFSFILFLNFTSQCSISWDFQYSSLNPLKLVTQSFLFFPSYNRLFSVIKFFTNCTWRIATLSVCNNRFCVIWDDNDFFFSLINLGIWIFIFLNYLIYKKKLLYFITIIIIFLLLEIIILFLFTGEKIKMLWTHVQKAPTYADVCRLSTKCKNKSSITVLGRHQYRND